MIWRSMELLAAYLPPERLTPGRWFWPKVERGHPMDCWPWRGSKMRNGYARLKWECGNEYAHRVAWLISGGSLVAGLVIMHTCDNPPCCNPAHLRQSTYADNTRDAISKGRYTQHLLRVRQDRCRRGHDIGPNSKAPEGRLPCGVCRACCRVRQHAMRDRRKTEAA